LPQRSMYSSHFDLSEVGLRVPNCALDPGYAA